eukprot:TRINITY_DN267_c3_g1_i1.p2 TRINITY_DN267_c3_g1~~TRINITY_DN267_c3_g1_i1.p2  ORF type:complete len:177 (-),score=71.45 TRINITY_DN267_c3_g1_i1:289-819(-)
MPGDAEWEAMLSQLATTIVAARTTGVKITPQPFEKDDDTNGHVGVVWSAGNVRAAAYAISPADAPTAKRISGNIIPAIATTTTAVSGLVMGEMVKVVQGGHHLASFRNAFMNLALPYFALSEPGPCPRTKISPTLYTTLWDSWAVKKGDITLQEFVEHFKVRFLHPSLCVCRASSS